MPGVRRLALAIVLLPLTALAQESAPSPVPTTLPEDPPPPLPPPAPVAPKKAHKPYRYVVPDAAYESPRRRAKRDEWYGYINLTCDALATTTLYLAAEQSGDRGDKLGYLALFTYLAGGPIAHWAHGNVGTGFASLGIRAGLPIVSGYLGCAALGGDGGDGDNYGCLGGIVIGLGLGVIGASVIDSAALAYKRDERSGYAMHVVPVATPTRHGATFGLAATF